MPKMGTVQNHERRSAAGQMELLKRIVHAQIASRGVRRWHLSICKLVLVFF